MSKEKDFLETDLLEDTKEQERQIEEELLDEELESLDKYQIAYVIEGLTEKDNPDKYLSKRQLKKNPPTLTLSDTNGSNATFFLTPKFVDRLRKDLEYVDMGFSGYTYLIKDKKTLKERILDIPNDAKKNPTFYVFLTVVGIITVGVWLYSKIGG